MTETERRLQALERKEKRKAESLANAQNIDITDYIADVYEPIHEDIQAGEHEFFNLVGGRGSGKSSYIALEIVAGIMQDPTGQSSAIVFRRTGNTLRESVFAQISWAIDMLGVSYLWRSSISPMTYSYLPTGAEIVFRGLDDSSKIKSIRPRKGYFRFVWFEEFNECTGSNFVRSVEQSVIRGGDRFTVFRSFNPPQSKINWANQFIDQPDDRALTLHTTYQDMPVDWLGSSFIYEAERLKEINPAAYQHEYMGVAVGEGSEVFPNITVRTLTNDEIQLFQYVYAGIDFGFSTDPAVYMRVAYDSKHDAVIFLDEIYKIHCSNKELADAIKEKGYDRKPELEFTPITGYASARERIVCDCAEPKSINDLQNEGLAAAPCKKFAGSVLYGIRWLQNRRLVFDPARTPHAYKEFSNYEYERTKDNEILADVPDRDNHTIDCTRYALDVLINRKGVSA